MFTANNNPVHYCANDRVFHIGEVYRHFKGNHYRILAIAEHTETKEVLVVYQSLADSTKVLARPFTMFASEVDHEKYPDVTQKFRFEKATGITKETAKIGP